MIDKYKKEKIKQLKNCSSDNELGNLINKIYEDGFSDGVNEYENANDNLLKTGGQHGKLNKNN